MKKGIVFQTEDVGAFIDAAVLVANGLLKGNLLAARLAMRAVTLLEHKSPGTAEQAVDLLSTASERR